jgi:hypothetical protein
VDSLGFIIITIIIVDTAAASVPCSLSELITSAIPGIGSQTVMVLGS